MGKEVFGMVNLLDLDMFLDRSIRACHKLNAHADKVEAGVEVLVFTVDPWGHASQRRAKAKLPHLPC